MLGIILGTRRAKKLGLDPEVLARLAAWVLVCAFVCARLAHVFLYRWVDYQDNPVDIVKMWEGGLSSYGGFVGAAIGAVVFLLRNRFDFFVYADLASFAFVPGWALGRVGCFVIHDHPGSPTDFFLGAQMKVEAYRLADVLGGRLMDAGALTFMKSARHDLGLYDGFLAAAIAATFYVADRKPRPRGFFLGWMCILYSVPRFFLDFLRATDLSWSDTRYVGLTPAQYGSIVLLAIGGWVLWHARRKSPERG